mgnify:CR=1 FL=1
MNFRESLISSPETAPAQDVIASRHTDSDSLSSSNLETQAHSLKMSLNDDHKDCESILSSTARLSTSDG